MYARWTRSEKGFLARTLVIAAILAFVCIAALLPGCTGEQLAPGGGASFAYTDANGHGVVWRSNKDISANTLMFNPQTGELTVNGLNSNASTLGAIQGHASEYQLNQWTTSYVATVNAIQSVAPLFFKQGGSVGINPVTGQVVVQQPAATSQPAANGP